MKKIDKKTKERLLRAFVLSENLNNLLEILASICKNLDLAYLNKKLKHFRYFQFTFFGLMARAKNLLHLVSFHSFALQSHIVQFEKISVDLKNFEGSVNDAYSLILKKNMEKGKNMIINLNKDYNKINNEIENICMNYLLSEKD